MYSIVLARQALTRRSKVKGQGHTVRKRSRRMVASDYNDCPVSLCCATCGRCRPGSAYRYDCLCFLVTYMSAFLSCHLFSPRWSGTSFSTY